MRRLLLAGATALAFPVASPAASDIGTMTGRQLMAACQSTRAEEVSFCEVAIMAIVVMHTIDQEAGKARKLFCAPMTAVPSDLRAAVTRTLGNEPSGDAEMFVGATVVALMKAYPCR